MLRRGCEVRKESGIKTLTTKKTQERKEMSTATSPSANVFSGFVEGLTHLPSLRLSVVSKPEGLQDKSARLLLRCMSMETR
ncbi:hypothetical protein D6C83_03167 [Aureobasidium pullulans]|uniref:Uncharacterized protein n=1 Tax=Aureobasidium pullulans TaxID=5580 RepID=A0A4T0DKM9_AURPU|nr:hypothetical protein D6C83_03167 [Aureobasidium pullulans]